MKSTLFVLKIFGIGLVACFVAFVLWPIWMPLMFGYVIYHEWQDKRT